MTSSSSPSRTGAPSLAVIDTPTAPPGWDDARADLIRIVDPLGRGVAWLAPGHRGRCVGYAVRPSGEKGTLWTHRFDAPDPGARSEGCGPNCAIIDDDGTEQPIALIWRFVERDPTFARLEAVTGSFDFTFTATLDRGVLELTFAVANTTHDSLRLRLAIEAGPDNVLAGDSINLSALSAHTIVAQIDERRDDADATPNPRPRQSIHPQAAGTR
jgi:hypothetical protein